MGGAESRSRASVTLINTGAFIGYHWHILARIWRTPVLGELFLATATRPLFRMLTNLGQKRKLPREFLDHMYDELRRADPARGAEALSPESTSAGRTARRQADALRPHDIPALVVWGGRDPYLGLDLAEPQQQAFPSARIVVFEDSGPLAFHRQPRAGRRDVVPFLREQAPCTPKEDLDGRRTVNRRYLLRERPDGRIDELDLRDCRGGGARAGAGQALVQNLYMSVDPTNRAWIGEEPTYLPPVGIGEVHAQRRPRPRGLVELDGLSGGLARDRASPAGRTTSSPAGWASR